MQSKKEETKSQKDLSRYKSFSPLNQTLIDFDFIPQGVSDSIITEYNNTKPVKGKVFDYLRTHRLNELLNHVEDFAL